MTGRPVTHDLATVTVRADHCMRADSLATALLVLGPERGYDWAEQHGVAAMFLSRSDDGVAERTTTAWATAVDGVPRE
jgi:thiamine biosynthesis lipoprotein